MSCGLEQTLEEGWHDYNPHNVRCEFCGSLLRFCWNRGEPVAWNCPKCGKDWGHNEK